MKRLRPIPLLLVGLASMSGMQTGPAMAGSAPVVPGGSAALCAFVGPCGDVNASGTVTAADALAVLKVGVGQPGSLQCAVDGGPPAAVPRTTGQTQCFATSGEGIDCAGTGQDGETQTGSAASFTDNGDGTVLDDATGLVWEKLGYAPGLGRHHYLELLTWEAAFGKIAELNSESFAGHDDWRLPNVRELQTLVKFEGSPPLTYAEFDDACMLGCLADTCGCTNQGNYWSSTSYLDSPGSAWAVGFFSGESYSIAKSSVEAVRAVRGGMAEAALPSGTSSLPAAAEASCSLVDPCGDVNASGAVSASDALTILKVAVGQPVVATCRTATSGPSSAFVLETGQDACFDSLGNGTGCGGTGQDGETRLGVTLAYTDNGNGTITDEETGLVWEKLDRSGAGSVHDVDRAFTWEQAFEKIESLNAMAFGGYDDWRLPNARELHTIIDYGRRRPAVDPVFDTACEDDCTTATCSCTLTFLYWSSTTLADDPTQARIVGFTDGYASGADKSGFQGVRAVRGGA